MSDSKSHSVLAVRSHRSKMTSKIGHVVIVPLAGWSVFVLLLLYQALTIW